ncbi:MAG: hypothetical protein WD042_07435 [Phycisphaeraceae bacterium]
MSQPNQPIASVRLRQQDQSRLLEQMSQTPSEPQQANRRGARFEYSGQIIVSVTHPNKAQATFVVPPRNLSAHGLAFLHGSYIYPGCRCELILPRLDRKGQKVAGTVRGCRHINGTIHEVAVIFDQPVQTENFVNRHADDIDAPPPEDTAKDLAADERG